MDYVAPKGWTICKEGEKEGTCSPPELVTRDYDGLRDWKCTRSEDCKGDQCDCRLAFVAPGGKQLRLKRLRASPAPPGWTLVCACLKGHDYTDSEWAALSQKDRDSIKLDGWDVFEDLGWIAPKGYKIVKPERSFCLMPDLSEEDELGHRRPPHWFCEKGWTCTASAECCLVMVQPGAKELHLLARAGVKYPNAKIPPGWGIFCICLEPE